MDTNKNKKKPRKINYYNPVKGFSKGTKQGIIVCSVLLAILIGLTTFSYVLPGTPKATVLDLVFGLCAAVAVVWVIGGTFEIEGKLFDFTVKATGGAAVLFLIIFYLQPISKSNHSPKYPASFKLLENATLEFIISEIDDLRRAGEVKYTFDFNDNEKEIRQFRPIEPDKETIYKAKDWPSIFEKIDQDSSCLNVTMMPNNVISLQLDVSKTRTKEVKLRGGNKITIRLCD